MTIRQINTACDLFEYVKALSDVMSKLGFADIATQLTRANMFASTGSSPTEFMGEAEIALLAAQRGHQNRLNEDQRKELASIIHVINQAFEQLGRK